MKSLLLAVSVLSLVFLAPYATAAPPDTTVHLMWTDATGTTYYLSTGSSSGICVVFNGDGEVPSSASCTSTTGYGSASDDGACGAVGGLGSCLVMNTLEDPRPTGTTGLKCSDGTVYTVSDGSAGECPPTDKTTGGGTIRCGQAGGSNFASASCEGGCGQISGNGSCTIK